MISLCLGITAFVLFLIYDVNSFLWQRRIPRTFFMIGTGLLGTAVILDLYAAWRAGAFCGPLDILLLAGGAVFFAALLYSLFFALPFKETYTEQKNGCRVYDRGVYALCRHPGILCFFGMYLLPGIAALPEKMLFHSILFSLLNLAYAWFQDCVTFPKTFCDYADYQKKVPFLIPTGESTRTAVRTLLHPNDEEANS